MLIGTCCRPAGGGCLAIERRECWEYAGCRARSPALGFALRERGPFKASYPSRRLDGSPTSAPRELLGNRASGPTSAPRLVPTSATSAGPTSATSKILALTANGHLNMNVCGTEGIPKQRQRGVVPTQRGSWGVLNDLFDAPHRTRGLNPCGASISEGLQ